MKSLEIVDSKGVRLERLTYLEKKDRRTGGPSAHLLTAILLKFEMKGGIMRYGNEAINSTQ